MIYIDRKLVIHMGSIMDGMEHVVTSLWDDFSWGIHFMPQIWLEFDPKDESVRLFSIIQYYLFDMKWQGQFSIFIRFLRLMAF